MNEKPLVSILVLNYNGGEFIVPCLRSILKLEYSRVQLIVIDNASTDSSLERARTVAPKAIFIQNSKNIGFARGINVGIRFALDHGAHLLWIVNPDTVVSPSSLSVLVQLLLKRPDIGIASPLILENDTKKVWFGGGKIEWHRFRAIHTHPRSATYPFETKFVSGCALLAKRNVFESVGFFDEHFFLYYEDADFSIRAKKAGFRIVIHPQSIVLHSEESRHFSEKTYWLVRSGLLFFRKHLPFFLIPYFWIVFWLRRIRNRHRLSHSQKKDWLLMEKALRDFRTYGY